ncbi:DNA phosphorothioation-associated protein 4 [Streptomyces sp. NPDC058092]|uniref:DNA phosphorothioation-associated protein 4 n=1 Tax=Streptomyces sp. NPDC058092 TaxID=3346336 RepID=UPI0036E8D308
MAVTDRFRRPHSYEQLLAKLTDKKTGPFLTMVEAMMFAAVLGHRKGERKPFEQFDEPIRLSVMEGRLYGDVLLDMLAAIEHEDDPKILGDERQAERVLIFEEYANGGLSHLQTLIGRQSNQDLDVIISNLVLEALRNPSEEEKKKKDDVGEILASADLDW